MLLLCGEVRDVEERRLNSVRHQLILAEREKLTLDGVLHVESFDDGEKKRPGKGFENSGHIVFPPTLLSEALWLETQR
jgi:hypothetical protein